MSDHAQASNQDTTAAAMETAQHAMSAWTQAWVESADGIMAAGLEQLELTRSLQGHAFQLLEQIAAKPTGPHDVAEEWFRLVRPTFETALAGYRRINDTLAGRLFSAAEHLTNGLVGNGTRS
jgi:Phasin protein